MIEFVLRQNGGPTSPADILHRLYELELLDRRSGIEDGNILFTAKAETERFVVEPNEAVWLTPSQFENLSVHFRKRIWQLMDVLRGGLEEDMSLTAAVLILALYSREKDSSPHLWARGSFKDRCLMQTIERLADRYPEPMKRVVFALGHVHHHLRSVVDQWLMFADLVKPDPAEAYSVVLELIRGRRGETGFVPFEVSWLMGQLISAQGPFGSLIDLHLDAGVMPVALNNYQGAPDKVVGRYLNDTANMLGRMNAALQGIDVRTSAFVVPFIEPEDYDRVMAAPPWGKMRDPYDPTGLRQVDATTIYAGVANSILSEQGMAVLLVPVGFLFKSDKRTSSLRAELLHEDRVEAVLQLPTGAFKPISNVQTAIVVLNRNKAPERRKQVLMIQLEVDPSTTDPLPRAVRQGFEDYKAWKNIPNRSQVAHVGAMQYDGFNLLPSRHTARATAMDMQRENVDGIMVHLAELVVADQFERVPSRISDRLNRMEDPPAFIRVRNLAKDPAFPYLQLDETEEIKGDVRIVDRDAVLVSRQFANPLPTIYQAKGGRIAIASNVLAIRPDTSRVLPDYLVHEMRQPYFLQQIKAISFGASIPAFNLEALLGTMIRLRPLERQHDIVGEKGTLESFLQRLENAQQGLDQKGVQEFAKLLHLSIPAIGHDGMAKYLHEWIRHEARLARQRTKEEVGHNLKTLQHQFNNRLSWVNTGIGTLEGYLQGLMDKGIIDEDDRIAPEQFDDEAPSPKLKEAIAQVLSNADELSSLLDRMGSSLERLDLKLEFIDLWEFVEHEVLPHYRGRPGFSVKVLREAQGPLDAYADRFRLKHALMNILDNAVKHGFIDDKTTHHLVIGVGFQEIVVGNDGVPPEITFDEMCIEERTAGRNAGSGHGMPIAVSLLKDFDATVEQIHPPRDRYGIPLSFALRIYIEPAS